LTITNSTLDSSPIGSITPSSGIFTTLSTTTGSIATSPSNPTDLVNKLYVDTVAQGLNPKQVCQCATTANITLSGLQTIDGYTTLAGDRVLVKNQTLQQNNGIYIAASGAWTRSLDMNVWSEVPGAYTVIINGLTNGNTGWVSTSASTGTIGTTPITFVQFSGNATYFAGTGLSLSSNTFSITNTTVTAGSYGSASNTLSATVNAQGQLTALSAQAISIAPSQINATIPNSGLTNSSITVNGNVIALGGTATITANTTNALTIGTGLSGTSFNGSSAVTINNIGVLSVTGTSPVNASTTSGATTISLATGYGDTQNPYSSKTASYFLAAPNGTAGVPTFRAIVASDIPVLNQNTTGTASNVTGIVAIANGGTGNTTGQASSVANSVTFNSSGTGSASPATFNGSSAITVSYNTLGASPLAGSSSLTTVGTISSGTWNGTLIGVTYGGTGQNAALTQGGVIYAASTTAMASTGAGSPNQVLTSNGTGAPTWANPTSATTVTDDTTSNTTEYVNFARQTTGALTSVYTASSQVKFNPSTGIFNAPIFSGSGANLTSIPNSALTNSTISGIALGSNLATLTIGTGLSGTSYNGSTAVTIANTGVTSITGTASQITASASTGAVTLSLPSTINVNTSGTAANVTGTVAIANGGTGQTTAINAFNALSPITSTGDLIIGNGTNSATRLPIGASTYVLTSNGTTATWAAPSGGGSSGSYVRTSFTATVGQTTFTVTYTPNYLQVYQNGVLLNAADYTATNGTSVVLAIGASTGDIIETVAFNTVTALTPAGANTQVQYNNAGVLAGSSLFTFNGTALTAPAHIATETITGALNAGAFSYGTLGYSDINIYASYTSSVNAYTQSILQNTNSGAASSVDFIVSNDVGTSSTYYGDFGMTSSGYNTPGQNIINTPSTVYLQAVSAPLAIGTLGAFTVSFYANSTLAAQISSAGLFTANSFASSSAAITGGSINSTPVGATTASTGAFTTLSATGAITHNTTTNNQSYTTTGAGTITMTSGTAGNINNMNIGATTAGTGAFTSLTATSRGTTGVLAKTGGKTAVTAVTGSLTLATGGTTLASQTAATGSTWRVMAYGTYAASSSANTRQFTMSCYWGTTQLTAVTTGNVLTNTAQTTSWKVEFELTASSTTAIWTTGILSSRVTSATIPLNNSATPASVTVTAGAQTLDFRVGQTGTATAGDTINVQQVVIERIV
jgi:hypothetical protein